MSQPRVGVYLGRTGVRAQLTTFVRRKMTKYDKLTALLAFILVVEIFFTERCAHKSVTETTVRCPNHPPQSRDDEVVLPPIKVDSDTKVQPVESMPTQRTSPEKIVIEKEVIIKIPPQDLFKDMFEMVSTEQIAGAMFSYALTPTHRCRQEVHMGHDPPKDGGWDVCLDVGVMPKNCTVYSFGISNDWSFDDDMVRYGCDVYSFDPTIGLQDHQRGEHHWFYNMGLWDDNIERVFDSKAKNGSLIKQHWTCRTVDYIREMLDHGDRAIDLLKIDIEGYEHRVFPQMLQSGILNHVKQLDFEMHMGVAETKRRRWNLYLALEKLMKSYDFVLWKVHPNELVEPKDFGEFAGAHPCCHDLSWVNKNFLKSRH